ncbi:MAG: ribosome biogenesis GTPase Der [Firmicutes bacterium]|nr:ribosome biogenesis GTPase Der [Bacillota bacterium]
MFPKPIVAVVGRPNVGKSTFFNKTCGRRISIVKDTPGVTRDRLYADAEWCGHTFTLIDTGGFGLPADDEFGGHIKKQAELAIRSADVILFLTDGKAGVMPEDYEVAELLRGCGKPVVLAVNKIDSFRPDLAYDFYDLGLGEPFPVSCEQGLGLGDLLDEVVKQITNYKLQITNSDDDKGSGVRGQGSGNMDKKEKSPIPNPESRAPEPLKIAVVGKPNVGKSSLVNKILGFERVIVSEIAGTTRDAIDTPFSHQGKDYIIIDTAGMRRKRGIEDESVESYSVMSALAAVRRADVVLLMIDAADGVSEQDARIAGLVHEEGKPSVFVMNKWDAVEKDGYTIEKFENVLKAEFAFMDYFKSIYVSAKTGQRVEKILSVANEAYANASRRITTGTLNDIISDAVTMHEPPSNRQGKRLKIFYATQGATCPPKFIIFVNDETLVHFSYKRYLENTLRRAADFSGTPIEVVFRTKSEL